MPDTYAIVPVVPMCDLCTVVPLADAHNGQPMKAFADVKLPKLGWANVCKPHFDRFDCHLGVGNGQRYVLPNTTATASVTMVIKGQPSEALRTPRAASPSALAALSNP